METRVKFSEDQKYWLNKAVIHCEEFGLPRIGQVMTEYLKTKNVEIAPRMCNKYLDTGIKADLQ